MTQHKKENLPSTYYWMSCGCKLYEKDLKRRYSQKVCSEHGGYLVKRTRSCFDCGVEIELCKKGNGKLRCPACEEIEKRKKMTIANEKALKKRAERNKLKPKKLKKAKPIRPPKPPTKEQKISHEESVAKSRSKQKMKGWSADLRGDYCKHLDKCQKDGPLDCAECTKFEGVFFGHDPRLAIGA